VIIRLIRVFRVPFLICCLLFIVCCFYFYWLLDIHYLILVILTNSNAGAGNNGQGFVGASTPPVSPEVIHIRPLQGHKFLIRCLLFIISCFPFLFGYWIFII